MAPPDPVLWLLRGCAPDATSGSGQRCETDMLKTPYLLFLGNVPDPLAAKVANGIKDWRPDLSVGQYRMDGCKADLGLKDMSIAEAKAAGAQTLVIGAANR